MIPSSQHQLPGATGVQPWRVQPHNPRAGGPRGYGALWAWRLEDGSVVLQSDDGDVTIPPDCLTSVANGLIAVHVRNGRKDAPAKVRATKPKGRPEVTESVNLTGMTDQQKAEVYEKQVQDMKDRQTQASDSDSGQSSR